MNALSAAGLADLAGVTEAEVERLAERLAVLVDRASREHGGVPVKWLGDGVMVHFRDPAGAVLAALGMAEEFPAAGLPPDRPASLRVVPAGAQVQVHPAALELELVDLALAVVLAVMLPVAPGLGAGRLAPAVRVTPVLAGRLKACLAADLSSNCRHQPGPPSSLA